MINRALTNKSCLENTCNSYIMVGPGRSSFIRFNPSVHTHLQMRFHEKSQSSQLINYVSAAAAIRLSCILKGKLCSGKFNNSLGPLYAQKISLSFSQATKSPRFRKFLQH